MNDFLIVNLAILAHAIPDFAVWFGLAKEGTNWKYARLFRICKWVYDFIITAPILLIFFIPWDIVIWFYLIKCAHGADSWYNVFSRWFGKQANWVGYWRWWSIPFGWLKTKFIYHEQLGGWVGSLRIIKGKVTRNEGYLSTIYAEILFIIYLLLKTYVF